MYFRDFELFWKVAEILADLTLFPASMTPAKNSLSHGAVLWIKTWRKKSHMVKRKATAEPPSHLNIPSDSSYKINKHLAPTNKNKIIRFPVSEVESQFPHRKVTIKRQRDVRQVFEMIDEIGRWDQSRLKRSARQINPIHICEIGGWYLQSTYITEFCKRKSDLFIRLQIRSLQNLIKSIIYK